MVVIAILIREAVVQLMQLSEKVPLGANLDNMDNMDNMDILIQVNYIFQ